MHNRIFYEGGASDLRSLLLSLTAEVERLEIDRDLIGAIRQEYGGVFDTLDTADEWGENETYEHYVEAVCLADELLLAIVEHAEAEGKAVKRIVLDDRQMVYHYMPI